MIVRAAVVPQPPLMVPELATGATAETATLRQACLAAAAALAEVAQCWVAVGADDGGRRRVPAGARGRFRGYGVDLAVGLAPVPPDVSAAADPGMPLPLLVAGWLREHGGAPAVTVSGELVAPDATPGQCRALGAQLATVLCGPEPAGLLVVGDGAATHTTKAPGYLDHRAARFDEVVAAALAAADPDALLALDPELARELLAVGRAPWQVLAGAALADGEWSGELLYSDAPFGVAYHVAVWENRR